MCKCVCYSTHVREALGRSKEGISPSGAGFQACVGCSFSSHDTLELLELIRLEPEAGDKSGRFERSWLLATKLGASPRAASDLDC